jgi:hypothetical protein
MAYIGKQPVRGQNRELDDISGSFNGGNTAFTMQVAGLNTSAGSVNQLFISVGGVLQNPGTDFTVADSTITFTTAPASGLDFWGIIQGDAVDINTPADASVSGSKLTNPLDLPDNHKIRFGTGNDIEIFHDGSNSYINEAGTGDLLLTATAGNIQLKKNTGDKMLQANVGGSVEIYHNNVKKIESASGGISLTGGAACNINALSDGASITIDMALALHHSVTLGGNRAFAQPTNQAIGQSGSIFITQDGTGSRTASWNAAFKWAGGTAPTLTTTAAAVDRIDYLIKASNVIHAVATLDVK